MPGLFAVFTAGLLTFLSPCVLPLVPVYLSLLSGLSLQELRGGAGRGRLLAGALAFAAGLSLVFVLLGLGVTALGGLLAEHRVALQRFGGLVAVLFGVRALGLLPLPFLDREFRPWLSRLGQGGSLVGAFLFGAAFSLGWTPCVGPVLGTVLTYTASSTSSPGTAVLLLATYALGLSLPLLAAALAAPVALRWLAALKPHLPRLEAATGLLLVGAGAWMLSGSFPAPSPELPTTRACETGGPGLVCAAPLGPVAGDVINTVKGPALIELTSQTCPVCESMAPVVEAAARACPRVPVLQLPVEGRRGSATATRHGVTGVPTFLFLDSAGKEVARLVGAQTVGTLKHEIQRSSGGACSSNSGG